MRRLPIGLASALALALVGSVAVGGIAATKPSLVVNACFERPALDGAASRALTTGQHVGAWRVAAGMVIVTPAIPPVETPPLGSQVMNLRPLPVPGSGDGEICQTVSGLVPSATYKLRLLAATVIGDSTIAVTLGGIAVGTLDLTSTLPAQFTAHEWKITATASVAALCPHGHPLSDGSVPLVDGVRLTPIAG